MTESASPSSPVVGWAEEAKARCDQATLGPWATRGEHNVFPSAGNRGYGILWDQHPDRDQLLADAEFIAHARDDLPRALAALDVAAQQVETLERENRELRASVALRGGGI